MKFLRTLFAAVCLVGAFSAHPVAVQAQEAASSEETRSATHTPGNRLLFTDQERELALKPGTQEILALSSLGLVIVIGLFQLRSRVIAGSAAMIFAGSLLFYGAWVFHKYTITGHFVILYGHLISLAIAAIGVTIGCLGLYSLIKEPGHKSGCARWWLLPHSLYLVFGLAVGTATIFEAAPTVFGIDPPLAQLAVFVVLGSAASAAALLGFARALCRMA